jgi:anti-anti-sigma factor
MVRHRPAPTAMRTETSRERPDDRIATAPCENITIVTIERTQRSDKVLLLVSGRMDAESASHFEQQCKACIAEGLIGLVIDLGELKYVSSMGLRAFVSVGKTLQDKGGALRICRLNGLVKQVFEITGLLGSFEAYESVEAALIGG